MKINEGFFIKAIKWLLAISFFAPLILSKNFYFPYIVPKTIFFQLLIEITLFLYVLLVISNRKYFPRLDVLAKGILLFFGIYVVSGLLGENPFRSFFDKYERMLGLFNIAHYLALYFIARGVLQEKKDWIFIFRAFLVPSFLVALYGLGQKFTHFSFLYNTGTDRIDATIGNAAFFAGYMLISCFVALLLMIKDKSLRIYYGASFFISFTAMYISATRGALVGFLAALIFLAIVFLIKKRSQLASYLNPKKNQYAKFTLIGIAIFFVMAFFAKDAFLGPIQRLSSISLSDTTTKTRIIAAFMTFEGFKEHPLLGWGPGNYNLLFNKYYDPLLYPAETWFDRAHDVIFDTLASGGILGLVTYLLIFATVFQILYQYKKKDENNFLTAYVVAALFLAYLIQNLFVFDSLPTYIPFFLFLAFVSHLSFKNEEIKESQKNIPVPTFILLGFLFLFLIYTFNVKQAMASYYGVQAMVTSPGEPNIAGTYFKKSLDLGFMGAPEMRTKMAEYAESLAQRKDVSDEDKKRFFEFTESEIQKTLKEEPDNVRYFLSFANVSIADKNNAEFEKKAEYVLDEAIKIAPNHPLAYLAQYRLKYLAGKKDEAIEYLKKISEITDYPSLYISLAKAYKSLDRKDEAIEAYKKAVDSNRATSADVASVAVEYSKMGEDDLALELLEKLKERYGEKKEIMDLIDNIKNGKAYKE